jgi:hypothetical protein
MKTVIFLISIILLSAPAMAKDKPNTKAKVTSYERMEKSMRIQREILIQDRYRNRTHYEFLDQGQKVHDQALRNREKRQLKENSERW